jgi:micrococcal nuclease
MMCMMDNISIMVRLVGIDAPEISSKKRGAGQPYSQQSKKYLASLVLNKNVELKRYGLDQYGRVLCVLFLDGKNINLEMIKAGLAEVYRGKQENGLDIEPHRKTEK